jgi:hypothetical protein
MWRGLNRIPLLCRLVHASFFGLMGYIVCWFLHRREREVLVQGVLPWGIDAVVFCWRCDRMRGRAVKVLQLNHLRA